MSEPTVTPATPTPWPRVAALVGLLTVALSVLLTAFAWPASRSEPRDVPVVVAGTESAVAPVREHLEQIGGDAFDLETVPDRQSAVDAIEDRDAYGAIVVDAVGTEVLTASAGSAVIAQTLGQVATAMAPQGASTASPPVTDVVPASEDDPRGSGLAAGALPLVFGGLAGGAGFALTAVGVGRRLTGVLALGVTGGLAMAAIWQHWLGALDGPYLANAGVIGLAVVAGGSAIVGLHALIGQAGVGVGAGLLMLLGNPLSGLSTAPEMLPAGWGDLGQLLPPGAAGSLLRSVAFFDGAGATGPLLVLLAWIAAGLGMSAVAAGRSTADRDVSAAEAAVAR